jgi:tRNA U34 5-carboxymethylaminomethyl modifying GTPase MnmE/TrmE
VTSALNQEEQQERAAAAAVRKNVMEDEEKLKMLLQRVSKSRGKKIRMGRIMIVGQGRVGKTALTNALIGKAFEPTDRSFECIET